MRLQVRALPHRQVSIPPLAGLKASPERRPV